VGEDMITVFIPMAPNPMGGFLIHVPTDRVYDVDLTVEEGVQTVMSTGVTLEAEKVHDIQEYADGEEGPDEADAPASADSGTADESGAGAQTADRGDRDG
jgi:uncharacterized membrane protein